MNEVIFREYDIRGVYQHEFDARFAYLLGRAFASSVREHFKKEKITLAIGHDARHSCGEIVEALAKGMNESGSNVLLLGLVTTPMTYFSTFNLDIDGAIQVTGSHNPPNYNGFKLSRGKSTIFGQDIQDLKERIKAEDFKEGTGSIENFDIFAPYIEHHKKEFHQLKNIPVVLDCGNGAAGVIARRLFEAVGITPDILFEEPDGDFPNHHPDPTVDENLEDLKLRVKETGAFVGIGFDGDGDRIGVVDQKGRTIYGDELIALFARFILQKFPGSPIVGDVKCSDRLYDYIEKYDGTPVMWKTGHSLIKEKIKTEKAPFGGEMSGHIFFADRNFGYDDAVYAGLRLVEILCETGQTIEEILSDLPKSFNTPEIRIDTTEEKKHQVVQLLKEAFSDKQSENYKLNLLDGIRISFKDGWALARASNTQPVLVLRFEATTAEGLQKMRKQIEELIEPVIQMNR